MLLLSEDAQWRDAVCRAARQAGVAECELASSVEDAYRRVVAQPDRYSHLLLQPSLAGSRLADLVSVTADGAEWGVELISLGETMQAPPDVTAVAEADAVALAILLRRKRPIADALHLDLGDLVSALQDSRIENRYQPVVSLQSGELLGLEVLARLRHPVLGTLLPDLFVPPIEQAGLSPELLAAVTGRSFAELAEYGRLGWSDEAEHWIAFNVPLDLMLSPDGTAAMVDRLAAFGLSPARIMLELTESLPVTDVPGLATAMERWRDAGFGLALDDISPLVENYVDLLDLPFTSVKLDKGTVMQAAVDPAALAFLEDVVGRSRRSGKKVIAEGIETWQSWHQMRELGVDKGQGFLVARPLPAAALPVWQRGWAQLLDQFRIGPE